MSGSSIHLEQYIDSIRDQLKPPVGNKLLFPGSDLKVMVVGGPNKREDFHINNGEELFYQLTGDMILKLVINGECRDVHIKEGDMFLLPANIPHSPQRFEGTIGLVFERCRGPNEMDTLRWYVPNSYTTILYQETFHCTDLGSQLNPIIERYFDSSMYKTKIPDIVYHEISHSLETSVHPPCPLSILIGSKTSAKIIHSEFQVDSFLGNLDCHLDASNLTPSNEIFCWQRSGFSTLTLTNPNDSKKIISLEEGDAIVLYLDCWNTTDGSKLRIEQAESRGSLLVVSNKNILRI